MEAGVPGKPALRQLGASFLRIFGPNYKLQTRISYSTLFKKIFFPLGAVCKFVTGKVDDFLTQNSTISEIETFVEKACDVFPGGVKSDCVSQPPRVHPLPPHLLIFRRNNQNFQSQTQFIEKYAPSLILALAKKLDPATICGEIKAC